MNNHNTYTNDNNKIDLLQTRHILFAALYAGTVVVLQPYCVVALLYVFGNFLLDSAFLINYNPVFGCVFFLASLHV